MRPAKPGRDGLRPSRAGHSSTNGCAIEAGETRRPGLEDQGAATNRRRATVPVGGRLPHENQFARADLATHLQTREVDAAAQRATGLVVALPDHRVLSW